MSYGQQNQPGEIDLTQSKNRHINTLADEAASKSKATVTSGLNVALGLKKPEERMEGLPLIKKPTNDMLGFVRTPMNVTMLLDVLKSNLRIEDGKAFFDFEKAREEFLRKTNKVFTESQSKDLFKYFVVVFTDKINDLSKDTVKAFYGEKKSKEEKEAALSLSKESTVMRTKAGIGELVDNQKKLLLEFGQGLSDVQREDLLRASLAAGYSTKAVFAAAREFQPRRREGGQRGEESSGKFQESNMLLPLLMNDAQRVAALLNDQVRRARRDLEEHENDEEYKAKYRAAYNQLANFLGGEGSAKRLLALGDRETDLIDRVLKTHLNASMALHTGRTDEVVPARAPRQTKV